MIVGLEHNDFTFYSIRKSSSHLKLLTAHSVLFLLACSLIHSVCAVRAVIVVALVLLIMAENG